MVVATEEWIARVRAVLGAYDEALLRPVATQLCRPRNRWPAEELIERSVAALQNPAVLDRRLKDFPTETRRVLALLRHANTGRWPVGTLCELGALAGAAFSHETVLELIQGGLLYPDVSANHRGKLKNLLVWLTQSPAPAVLVPASVTQRLASEEAGPDPELPTVLPAGAVLETDGLEWLLRLAVMHQILRAGPLRRTQNGELFKRDLDRLRGPGLLNAAVGDALVELPDVDLFTVELGLALGIVTETQGELRAGVFPPGWQAGLPAALGELWTALLSVTAWDPVKGWDASRRPASPFPSVWLYTLALLGRLAPERWVSADALESRIAAAHPYWAGNVKDPAAAGVVRFLLGLAYPMRLVQVTRSSDDTWGVRLSLLGRAALGLGSATPTPGFPQTLLVQPNLEILAYRQGMTPELIPRLGNFATWKTLGAACTLQLEPASVYAALENGETFDSIVRTLERHGMKATPTAVLDALRTWADKRDRITVYPAAALFEFASAADLSEALDRGLPAVRLTDRLAVVPREGDIDYKHFRLTGTRDYLLPPERCVEIEPDGTTLVVDLARSDLLLETELMRFAEPLARTPPPGKKFYRLTPESLKQARQMGASWATLEAWSQQRTGLPGSPAARLLYAAADLPPVELRRQLVLHVSGAEVADGLMQWPATQALIDGRLGPVALAVAEKDVAALTEILRELGITVRFEQV